MKNTNYPFTLLFDGACPLCRLEMGRLAERNALNRLLFTDISVPGFDAAPYGASLQAMLALIHGLRPDGTLVIGVAALRTAYEAVGLGAWAAPTALPGLKPIFDWLYAGFARNRYGFSRLAMPLLNRIEAARVNKQAAQALRRSQACAQGVCEVPNPDNQKRSAV